LRDKGYEVVNPFDLDWNELGKRRLTWPEYLRRDLQALLTCDGIYMIRGWQNSKGARLERNVAKRLGMKISRSHGDD
jgi:hypothetical protein